jgi:hypothetical protein
MENNKKKRHALIVVTLPTEGLREISVPSVV